jgi:hypothetical protein
LRILIDKCIEFELNSIFDEFCLFSNDNEILMFFYVNDIVFAFTASRKKNAKNLIRRLKNIFDIRNLDSLNFFFDVWILQKLDTIWLIQNFYMNKLIKNYVINIEYKAKRSYHINCWCRTLTMWIKKKFTFIVKKWNWFFILL